MTDTRHEPRSRAHSTWAHHPILHRMLRALEFTMAGLFLYLGSAKLVGTPSAVRLFHDIGWGQWFRYVTGLFEVGGAILLLVPTWAGASAILLVMVMAVATVIEVLVLHRPPAAAMACMAAHAVIARGRRAQTRRLLARAHVSHATHVGMPRPKHLRGAIRAPRRPPSGSRPAPGVASRVD